MSKRDALITYLLSCAQSCEIVEIELDKSIMIGYYPYMGDGHSFIVSVEGKQEVAFPTAEEAVDDFLRLSEKE